LHRRKNSFVSWASVGDRQAPSDDAFENVTSGRVGESPEHPIDFTVRKLIYNHMLYDIEADVETQVGIW